MTDSTTPLAAGAEAAAPAEAPGTEPPSPYTLLGGETALRTLVDRFYDLLEQDPQFKALRAMHAADLAPMREKLFDFLSGWLGGPPRYFQRPDRACIVSAHGPYSIGAPERDEWMACMRKAIAGLPLEPAFGRALDAALYRTADALRNR